MPIKVCGNFYIFPSAGHFDSIALPAVGQIGPITLPEAGQFERITIQLGNSIRLFYKQKAVEQSNSIIFQERLTKHPSLSRIKPQSLS